MTSEDVLTVLVSSVRDLAASGAIPAGLMGASLDMGMPLRDLGLDSVGRVALLSELESRCDVLLSEIDVVGMVTVADLAETTTRAVNREIERRALRGQQK